jgi:hypothetical protein
MKEDSKPEFHTQKIVLELEVLLPVPVPLRHIGILFVSQIFAYAFSLDFRPNKITCNIIDNI